MASPTVNERTQILFDCNTDTKYLVYISTYIYTCIIKDKTMLYHHAFFSLYMYIIIIIFFDSLFEIQ
ncbi:uncharacterized protein BX663DRAFT_511691 [Cokeromyces recurvatus]|uniref:uncharacterized protein n=1 Tax=Cokeromyces recurvatus TaxID=90255 RepID=UPI00221F23D8|nr:uncharacterized protein BX663DRAFT_511691 [Cokeromyces recurvatus]KAI7902087.1 hypothetical protein BX663DRAFT_511691 [Cokeromyces recurvatus]